MFILNYSVFISNQFHVYSEIFCVYSHQFHVYYKLFNIYSKLCLFVLNVMLLAAAKLSHFSSYQSQSDRNRISEKQLKKRDPPSAADFAALSAGIKDALAVR